MATQTHVTVLDVTSGEQILTTREVMLQLRPLVPTDRYVETVQRMMRTSGYRMAAVYEGDEARAVAGYRFMEMLYCGRILYVDDLSTDERHRSRGFGNKLLDWLKTLALAENCSELHLDSGVQREKAHRFYFREGMAISAYHFRIPVYLPRSQMTE